MADDDDAEVTEESAYSYKFHDGSLSSQILTGLNDLRLAKKFFDMTLSVGKHRFSCHRVVLASSSDYFRSMFGGMMRESFTDKVTIFDVEPIIMQLLIEFCYTGDVEITIENVEPLLKAADLFQFSTIKDACCHFLGNHLHTSNCLNIEHFADSMCCTDLANKALSYIARHIVEVVQLPEFLHLPVEKILKFLIHPNLNIEKEEHAYEIALFWIKGDVWTRAKYFDRFVEQIRFPFIRRIYILLKIETNVLVRSSRLCQNIIKETRSIHNCDLDRHQRPSIRLQPRPSTGIAEVLVTLGGCDNNCDELICIDCLNPVTGQWRYLAECPETIRGGFSAVALDNDIFVTGGSDGFHMFKTAWRYKSQVNEWVTIASMSQPREYHASVALKTSIYVIGSEGCERYDLVSNRWNQLASLPSLVNNCSVTACSGKIYVIGSKVANNDILIQIYHPLQDQWETLDCDLPTICPSAFVPSMKSLAGKLYLIREDSTQVLTYDPSNKLWSDRIAPMLQLHLGGCVTQYSGKLVISGGYDERFGLSDTMEEYDPTKDKWGIFTKLPQPMFWHGCVSIFKYVSSPKGDFFDAPPSLHDFSVLESKT